MQKPIICFEGPSGIGKTTLCNILSNQFNIVPEVNLLFQRTGSESKYWYHERQIERYELCKKSTSSSILDGDIFQPIWYNWVCKYPLEFLSKEETHRFYYENLMQGKIRFPDLYVVFFVDEKELWIRKERDTTRRRRNFKKHLEIIEPLKKYYRFLDQDTEIEMRFVHYSDIESAKKSVLSLIQSLKQKSIIDEIKVFRQIENWISRNS
ncbi:MAG: hypothetical protein AAGA77_23505 [Bacteroidota bacterium]